MKNLNLVILFGLLTFTQSAHAITCYEITRIHTESSSHVAYVQNGAKVTFNAVLGVFFREHVKLRDADGTVTVFHGMKGTPPGGQGADTILTNGLAELNVHQDWQNPDRDLGKGEFATFYPEGRASQEQSIAIEFFCTGLAHY